MGKLILVARLAARDLRHRPSDAVAEGRDQAAAALDRSLLTAGTWARPGTVVLERGFAAALGVGVGNLISLNGQSFHVSGIAVSAALPPYPSICAAPVCDFATAFPGQPGLIWMTKADLLAPLKPPYQVSWYVNLRLAWWLASVVVATPLAVGALTVIPSRIAARTGVVPVLRSEAA